jgi:hypothetical protein
LLRTRKNRERAQGFSNLPIRQTRRLVYVHLAYRF